MEILDAAVADAAEIIELQKLAYLSEAAIYNDYAIPPLTQSVEDLITVFDHKTILKAVKDRRIIGSVNGFMKDSTCMIGRLMVHPDFRGQGIGARLMGAMEARFSSAQSWELFTGEMSLRNIRLYERLGYGIIRKEAFEGSCFAIVIMRKMRRQGVEDGGAGADQRTGEKDRQMKLRYQFFQLSHWQRVDTWGHLICLVSRIDYKAAITFQIFHDRTEPV